MNGKTEHTFHDHSPRWACLAFGEDAHILGRKFPQDSIQADDLIRRGLPAELVEGLAALPCIQKDATFQGVFGITRKTYRAHLNGGLRLSSKTSNAVWRFAMIFGRLHGALKDRDAVQRWLCTAQPNRLSGKTPLALLSTGPGLDAVAACIASLGHPNNSQFPSGRHHPASM